MIETELLGLAMAKRLVVEPPTFSLFFYFNLVSFLIIGIAGVIKFRSNSYSLARLSFCLATSICLIYQLPLVIFSDRVESSLREAWTYALVVNGAAMLLMSWTYLSRRFDFPEGHPAYPGKTTEVYLITGILGIALMWVYLSGVPWDCTGLFALLSDPSYTLLARELGVKLIGTSFSTYSLGAYAGAFAPVFLLLSIWRVEDFISRRKVVAALVSVACGFIAVAALLVSGVKGLLMPSTLMLAVAIYFYRKTWRSRLLAFAVTALFFFLSLFTFELLKERGSVGEGGGYDFAACSVKVGACQRSFSLLESMKGQEISLGVPGAYVGLIQSRLTCLCDGRDERSCPDGAVGYPIKKTWTNTNIGASLYEFTGGLSDRFVTYAGAILYRIFVVPFQVSVWHFMYAETEAVEGVKTLPFARRVLGDSLNMPEMVYQKYGSIYWQGDRTNTSSAPTSFIWAYSAYLGWIGFCLALGCILSLDLVLAGLARFAGVALIPILIGMVMIMSANFLVSDFVTVLLSHGGIAGMFVLLIYAVLLKRKT